MSEFRTADAHPQTPDAGRRGVLRLMFGSLFGLGLSALAAACGLWTAATARFLMPNVVTEPGRRFKVGPVSNYPSGYVETRYKEKYGVWIVNGQIAGQAQIYALRTVCTHLGCITTWQANDLKFKCPCHGSGFSIDGINREGPAPRPLERCAIRVADDGQLEVDRGRIFQYELGQWNDPDSFVAV
jgi:cytochrome b6-f complex iron-sulfur subunit